MDTMRATAALLPFLLLVPTQVRAEVAVPAAVRAAAERSALPPGATVEIIQYQPPALERCLAQRAELSPMEGSGKVAVRLAGTDRAGMPCQAWGWLWLRVEGPALVVTRDVEAGAPLEEAVSLERRELHAARPMLVELPTGAVASRRLRAGTALSKEAVRTGPAAGSAITVVLRSGALLVEQPGRTVRCGGFESCAVLASGKRVQGTLQGHRLTVEMP